MTTGLWAVDSFAEQAFKGNPAAVCLLERPAPANWMQSLAGELNLSETAFVSPGEGLSTFALRWFTPAAEVDLCGHATLASAWVLYHTGAASRKQPIAFETRSGSLSATWVGKDRIQLDFPSTPANREASALADDLRRALGVRDLEVIGRNDDILVLLPSPESLRSLVPDLPRLKAIDARGIIVTATSDRPDSDFLSRFFGPAVGVDEDPVTGSAHCTLGPFWAERLGRSHLVGYQESSRGGSVRVEVREHRVLLSGSVIPVWNGSVLVPPA